MSADHVPGVDDVAPALRHLLALGVEDQPQTDAVAVAGGVEEQCRLGEQRVEPAAGLVDRLADVVGRETLLELRLALERVVELGEGHRAAVVPGVDHRLDPAHLPAALLAIEDDLVDVGAVQILGDLAAGALAQLGDRAGAKTPVAALADALPDRQRRPPVAVARERPVDVVLEPFAEAAVPDVLGMPADLPVVGKQLVAGSRGGDVPARLGVVEERRAAAPAVRVGVLVDLLAEEQAAALEVVDQAAGHLGVFDELPLEADDPFVELAVEADRVVEAGVVGGVEDPVPGGDRIVVLAEGGSDMDEAGAVLGCDEVAREDREAAGLLVVEGEHRASVMAADQIPAGEPFRNLDVLAEHLLHQRLGEDQPLPVDHGLDVGDVGSDRDRPVAGQRPGRRRPDQERLALGVEQREAHVYGGVLDVLVAERDLVRGERRAAARAVGDDLVALVEALVVPEPAKAPPDRLDVVVVEGDVGVVEVDPEADPLGQPIPLLDVLEDRLAAAGVEPVDPVLLDLLLG